MGAYTTLLSGVSYTYSMEKLRHSTARVHRLAVKEEKNAHSTKNVTEKLRACSK